MHTHGHHVLITGGAKGIGLALAHRFHAAGNRVTLVGRDTAALAAAAQALPGAQTWAGDIAQPEARARLVTEVPDISVLVNNAGVQCNGEVSQMSADDIQTELGINLLAPVLLTHAYLPQLQRQAEAAVINLTSVLALSPKQSASVYCATKAGLHSFTRSLRWQLEDSPVRVFEVMPPLVDTAMTAGRGTGKITPDALAAEFWVGYQANRLDMPIGKARAITFLARWMPSVVERVMRRG